MPDRSLIFFYAFMFCAIIYIIIKITRDTHRLYSLAYLLCLLASIAFVSHFYPNRSGLWALGLSFVICFAGHVIFFLVQLRLRVKRFKNQLSTMKTAGASCLESLFLAEPEGRWYSLYWHVAYFPEQNTLEIASNIFHNKFELNKKFYCKTLTGKTVYITPESLLSTFTLEQSFICPLKMFTQHSEQARALVANYAEGIKNGSPEPWKLYKQEG
ncbi:hypothetical protein ACQ86O_10925 [Serratia sp. L9]|uniref:hypothetical protein n=1 Tax=Serratia sp. L9 TaxID=3423946 RepID=UPI003D665C31